MNNEHGHEPVNLKTYNGLVLCDRCRFQCWDCGCTALDVCNVLKLEDKLKKAIELLEEAVDYMADNNMPSWRLEAKIGKFIRETE